jgi:hypothetical protein
MANKIIVTDDGICVRLDGAFVGGSGKYLIEPFEKEVNGETKHSYFGSFRFLNPREAEATLQNAVLKLDAEDTIFFGFYPKWKTDDFGDFLAVNNRVKFFATIDGEEVNADQIRDYIYSLEIHLTKTKKNEIFMRVPRAIVIGKVKAKYNDSLFDDLKKVDPFGDVNAEITISDDDLPF